MTAVRCRPRVTTGLSELVGCATVWSSRPVREECRHVIQRESLRETPVDYVHNLSGTTPQNASITVHCSTAAIA